jgi:hypothetical protein
MKMSEAIARGAALANQFARAEQSRSRDAAASGLKAAIGLGMARPKASLASIAELRSVGRKLQANKPGKQFAPREGYYFDPSRPWLFKRHGGGSVIDEPLRNWFRTTALLDQLIEAQWAEIRRDMLAEVWARVLENVMSKGEFH